MKKVSINRVKIAVSLITVLLLIMIILRIILFLFGIENGKIDDIFIYFCIFFSISNVILIILLKLLRRSSLKNKEGNEE